MPLAVQPQRQAAALPARDVIPPELLPISENSAIGHQSLHCFPVSRKTRPEQTAGKDAFVAGLPYNGFCDAVPGFLRRDVPSRWSTLCDSVTDNFRVISPGDF